MRSNVKMVLLCSLLMSFYAVSNAQDYYGGGSSWRRQPSNQDQDKDKDKDNSTTEPSGYLSINFGFANPEGNFAEPFSQSGYSQGVGTGYGNYAQPGSVFHFSLGFPINHSNFGFALMFGSYDNGYDINSYVNTLANSNVGNPYSSSPITGYAPAPGQNDYSESSIMGGFFVTYPVGRLSIDGRLMLGALLSSLPEQDVYAQDAANDELEYDTEPSNATSLAFDIGIGARFMIAQLGRRKLCAMINVDYLYSNVSYNTQQDLYVVPFAGTYAGYQASLTPTPTVTGNLPIELLNVTFGIGYQL